MQQVSERAPAKVNLSLRVHGRRSDGFHEISSLVAFASLADTLTVSRAEANALSVTGPFSSPLEGSENLVTLAVSKFRKHCPSAQPLSVTLDKQIPVAAGLGGGSADAAAMLRVLNDMTPDSLSAQQLDDCAASLGSDVIVCHRSRTAWMLGRGEIVRLISDFPPLPAILVNPGVQLGAGEVYSALGAASLDKEDGARDIRVTNFSCITDVTAYLSENENDLQPPATKLAPVIGDVIQVIESVEGCALARMSGSGSTCFGIFGSQVDAAEARTRIANAHPDWWVVDTTLG